MTKTAAMASPGWQRVPHILVVFWLLLIGAAIWQHAVNSQQPPIHDPLSYVMKGKNLWDSLQQGTWVNPLNVEPTARPPGTVLMSYPFGYSADLRGFYFRSAFFPIVCVVLAVYMASGLRHAQSAGWETAAVAVLFSSLPMYYQFEYVEGLSHVLRWGMVDAFQGGLAALASAALVRSVQTQSTCWLCAAAAFAVLTLLVKPSGGMVMLLVGLAWSIAVALSWLESAGNPAIRQHLRRYALRGGFWLTGIYLVFTTLCLGSNYLSRENFAFAGKVLAVQKGLDVTSLSDLPRLVHGSVGEPILIWSGGMLACWVALLATAAGEWRAQLRLAGRFWLFTALFWAGGLWFWAVVQVGGEQFRYFFPFFFMGLIAIVPATAPLWPRCAGWFRWVVVTACLLPAINIALLLAQDQPPRAWQTATGVAISLGANAEEVREARDFLSEVRARGRSVEMYAFSSGIAGMVFESAGAYEGVVRPEMPTFHTKRQIDWTSGLVTRLHDLLACQFVLFRVGIGQKVLTQALQLKRIDNFNQENQAFRAWLTGLSGSDGIRVTMNGPRLRLIEISEPELFKRRLAEFVAGRSWRPEFSAANPP